MIRFLIGLICVVLVGTVVVIVLVSEKSHDERERAGIEDVRKLRAPATDQEIQAAGVAIAFVEMLRNRDVSRACSLARDAAARELSCDGAPRIPDALRVPADQTVQAADVPRARTRGTIAIGIPVKGRSILRVDPRGKVVLAG